MDDTLELDKVLSIYHDILDNLSENIDESFFLFDIEPQTLYFPRAMGQDYSIMQDGSDCCSLEDWYSITYGPKQSGGAAAIHLEPSYLWQSDCALYRYPCAGGTKPALFEGISPHHQRR
ncbi:MAG: hypothetical protein ACOX7N_01655 [Lawsonibacter sp.]